jgi:hypothetical protein
MSSRMEAILLTLCRLLSVSAGRCNHDHACDQHQDFVHHECKDHFWVYDKCQDLFHDYQDRCVDNKQWLDHDPSSLRIVRQPLRWQANLRQPVLRFGGSVARHSVFAFESGGQGQRCCQNWLVRVAVSWILDCILSSNTDRSQ